MEPNSVGVVVATFGDQKHWDPFALRAVSSALKQTHPPQQVLRVHGESLAAARNKAAEALSTNWLIFLDADDELDEQYVESMLALEEAHSIRRPATLGITDGVEDGFPVLIPRTNLLLRNFIVIGAMMPRELFLNLGGFDEYPILEDWAFWLKAWIAGASILDCSDAIYRVHGRSESRNAHPLEHGQMYTQIRARFEPLAHEKGLV